MNNYSTLYEANEENDVRDGHIVSLEGHAPLNPNREFHPKDGQEVLFNHHLKKGTVGVFRGESHDPDVAKFNKKQRHAQYYHVEHKGQIYNVHHKNIFVPHDADRPQTQANLADKERQYGGQVHDASGFQTRDTKDPHLTKADRLIHQQGKKLIDTDVTPNVNSDADKAHRARQQAQLDLFNIKTGGVTPGAKQWKSAVGAKSTTDMRSKILAESGNRGKTALRQIQTQLNVPHGSELSPEEASMTSDQRREAGKAK